MGTLEQEDLTQGKRIFSDMMLYTEGPKDATRKLLELINKFGKATDYKISTWKSVAFLYTNNKRSEMKFKKQYIYHCIKKNKIPMSKLI